MTVRIGKIELTGVQDLHTEEARTLVEQRVPEQQGSVFQDLGREPLTLVIEGLILGDEALSTLENLRQAAVYIRGHHERWDGQGYPDGLSGLTIPYGARIIAVANDFDGLQAGLFSPRRLKPEEAITFIQQNRGKRYCPQVVDAFLEVMGASDQVSPAGHEIGTSALRPGMVLARDLVGKDGVMLLAADFVLDESLIRQLRELEASEGTRLSIAVRPAQGA